MQPGEQQTEKITLNDEIKRAVVACARDEIRKLIGGLGPRHAKTEPSVAPFSNNITRTSKNRKHTSTLRERPFTASHYETTREKAYKGRQPFRRIKSYSKIQCSKQTRLSSTMGGIGATDPLSFASAKWIEKSADLVRKSGSKRASTVLEKKQWKEEIDYGEVSNALQREGEVCYEKNPSQRNASQKGTEADSLNVCLPISKSKSVPTMKSQNLLVKSNYRLRKAARPRTTSTALERRAPVRPSSSYLVRAKAESFGRTLLDEFHFDSTNEEGPDPMPFLLDTNEWENELAKHIVSVYNNKVVSEVRKGDNLSLNENDINAPETVGTNDATQVSAHTRKFFEQTSSSPHSSQHVTSSTVRSEKTPSVKASSTSSTPLPSKREKVLRQTKYLIHNTAPRMVWLTGTGEVPEDWPELEPLNTYDKGVFKNFLSGGKYMKCITMIKSSICSLSLISDSNEDMSIQQQSLWKRLVLTSNTFTTQLITQRKFSQAIEMLEVTESLVASDFIQDQDCTKELTAFIKETHAFYYSKRGKPSAALQYIVSATNMQKQRIIDCTSAEGDTKNGSIEKIRPLRIQMAKFHLHRAFILQQLNRFDDTMKYINLALNLVLRVDDEVLMSNPKMEGIAYGPPQVLIIVAVAYHNIAVQQILLGQIGDACISSQNCRRLSRQCMTLSSRYIGQFEDTHMKALYELSSIVRNKQTDEEALVFQRLMSELFD